MTHKAPWQRDETVQIGTDYESLDEIRIYDQKMSRMRDLRREIQDISVQLVLSPGQMVLEIGTGTGNFAIFAAGIGAEVIAADVSAPMLEYAKEKAKARLGKDAERIRFVNAGFLSYEHEGPLFDAIVTQLALHHLPDFWKQVALFRLSDILKEGGKLYIMDAVYSFDHKEYENFFQGYLEKVAKSCDETSIENITTHIKDEYSTMNWIMEGMLKRAGFIVENADYKNGFIATYLCTKRSDRK